MTRRPRITLPKPPKTHTKAPVIQRRGHGSSIVYPDQEFVKPHGTLETYGDYHKVLFRERQQKKGK